MKILFFSMNFFSKNFKGGTEIYLYNLIRHLRERHQIILMIPNRFKASIKNVKTYYFSDGYTKIPLFILQLIKVLKLERPHIISAFIPTFYASIAFLMGRILHIKNILNLRGMEKPSKMQILSNTLAFFFTNQIVTNAPDLFPKYAYVQKLPLKMYKNIPRAFIPNAVDLSFWTESSRSSTFQYDIVYVGNLHNQERINQKGFRHLSNAVSMIKKTYQKALKIIVIGEYNLNLIKKMIPSFDHDQYFFTGIIFKDEIKKILKTAQIFVLSSEIEGMPNALMEALAFGMPAVATNVGSVKKLIIDNQTGFIVPSKNASQLAEKIWILLNNPELCQRFSKNAQVHMIQNFDWDTNIKKIEKVYAKKY